MCSFGCMPNAFECFVTQVQTLFATKLQMRLAYEDKRAICTLLTSFDHVYWCTIAITACWIADYSCKAVTTA